MIHLFKMFKKGCGLFILNCVSPQFVSVRLIHFFLVDQMKAYCFIDLICIYSTAGHIFHQKSVRKRLSFEEQTLPQQLPSNAKDLSVEFQS